MAGRSAVIVEMPLPPALAAVRDAGDTMARLGVPPHVTVLFPFLPADQLAPSVRASLAQIAAGHSRFVATMGSPELREEMVWLVPLDQRPFLQLTAAVHARWPRHPPYEGAHPELIAHLTLIETPDRRAQEAALAAVLKVGAFDVAVTDVTLLAEDDAGRWDRRWRLPLGAPPRERP